MPDFLADTAAAQQSDKSATETLNQVGVLLSQPKLWGRWLADHPDRGPLFKEIFSCLVRLRSETGWSDDQILERLGCDTKSEEELSSLTKEHLETCLGYMLWVESLVKLHDVPVDKREIVEEAASFFAAAKRDLSRVEKAMRKGAFTAEEYLELGEIKQAWELARAQLIDSGGEVLAAAERDALHLSPKRLEVLASPDADELLGPRVARRMRVHLGHCTSCEAAARKVGVATALDEDTPATV